MEVISRRIGKRKGVHSITVHLLKQGEREQSRTITVSGINLDKLYELILFFLKTLEASEGKSFNIQGGN